MDSPAAQLIREEIRLHGIISFARFMELALYAPAHGYYETRDPVGRAGDFYTSVSAGPLFGRLLARHFAQWLEASDVIAEAGANNGQLALDILKELRAHAPNLAGSLGYVILEPSPVQQARQAQTLHGWPVKWVRSLDEMHGFCGALISNELLDAMPVELWRWDKQAGAWRQMGVIASARGFEYAPLPKNPLSQLPWIELPAGILELLPDGFQVEEHTAAVEWWRRAASALGGGWLIAFDYGLDAEEFFSPERAQGTLRSYARHRPGAHVLSSPGAQDITAHVNFSSIRRAGEASGLSTLYDSSQARFLHGIAESWLTSRPEEWTSKMGREFQTLTHPEHLGRAFRTLVQHRPRPSPQPPRAMPE